jgi:phage terminase large subunit GpA-like protein
MQLTIPADIACPHCGETFALEIDTSQHEQDLIEDCSICCRPIALMVRCRPGEIVEISAAN